MFTVQLFSWILVCRPVSLYVHQFLFCAVVAVVAETVSVKKNKNKGLA